MNAVRGFTLIETMIVVLVVGIVMAVGIPSFATYRHTLLKKRVKAQLVQDLRAARQMAITQRSPVIVTFGDGVVTTNVTTYSVHTDKNADGVRQGSEPFSQKQLPKDSKLTNVNLTPTDLVKFDISGVLVPGTSGGTLIFQTTTSTRDTLLVSMGGMVYRP